MDAKRPTIKQIKQYLKLIDAHKLDSFEIPGFKAAKTRHSYTEKPAPAPDLGKYEPTTVEELDAQIRKELGIQ